MLSAAQDLRRSGCGGHAGTNVALRRDERLDRAARAWARSGGKQDLAAVLESVGVRSRASASLALSRTTAADLSAGLQRRLCTELTTPAWTALGSVETDGRWWIVVGELSAPPRADQADAIAAQVLALTNAVRARGARCGSTRHGPAGPLRLARALNLAAAIQASDMAGSGHLAHEGRDGSTPARRVERTGYAWQAVGENVAAGPESAAEVVQGWENSPEHCRNLMDPDFTELGIAYAQSPRPTGHGTWWSMVLARPRETRQPPKPPKR